MNNLNLNTSYLDEDLAKSKLEELKINDFADFEQFVIEESRLVDNAIARICLYTRVYLGPNTSANAGDQLRKVIEDIMKNSQEKVEKYISKAFPKWEE